jgi:hypothetical protein
LFVVFIAALWAIFGRGSNTLGPGSEIILLALSFGFIPDLVGGHGENERAPERPSKLEADIRDLLDGLGDDFHVLHDLESPHGMIRHVIFSRGAGVFLIEARPDRSRPSPTRPSPSSEGYKPEAHIVDQCTAKSFWLRDRITEIVGEKPWITTLLVMPNAFVPQDMKVDGVRILNEALLLTALSQSGGRRRKSGLIWDARRLICDSLTG